MLTSSFYLYLYRMLQQIVLWIKWFQGGREKISDKERSICLTNWKLVQSWKERLEFSSMTQQWSVNLRDQRQSECLNRRQKSGCSVFIYQKNALVANCTLKYQKRKHSSFVSKDHVSFQMSRCLVNVPIYTVLWLNA